MTESIITVSGLKYQYEDEAIPALSGVSLEIAAHSFTAILGRNGSGKSTLAKHFNAILQPEEGTVTVLGMDTADGEKTLLIRRNVGMVFQNPDNQIVANVVEDDVAFAPENLGVPPAEIRERVDGALRAVGMYDYRLHAPHLLSGGQKQRVAIAGIIAMRPKCIVLDEPTAMLDPAGRREIMNTLQTLRERFGITIILITHHMDECLAADRVIVMSEGKIAMDGAPARVFSRTEELRALGLDSPYTIRLLYELNRRGLRMPPDALSIEDCAGAIALAMR